MINKGVKMTGGEIIDVFSKEIQITKINNYHFILNAIPRASDYNDVRSRLTESSEILHKYS